MNIETKETIIALLKGLFYKSENEKLFDELLRAIGAIQDYFDVIGLEVIVDESEGYAYLKSKNYADETQEVSKLIQSRELSYKVSLLCVLLRKEIVNFDIQQEGSRAIISADEIKKRVSIYLPKQFNETKFDKELQSIIKRVEELGFLRKLKSQEDNYEIKRAIKAFVDASWLDRFDERLNEYKESEKWS